MKKSYYLILAYLCFITAVSALNVGDKVPEIAVDKWYNKPPQLIKESKGKKVFLVEFWASWCKACLPSVKFLNQIQKKYKDKELVIVGITAEKKDDIMSFIREHNISYSIGFDEGEIIISKYVSENDGIPVAFLIDREGEIVYKGHPMQMGKILVQVLNGTYNKEDREKLMFLLTLFKKQLKNFELMKASETAEKILYLSPDNKEAMQFRLMAFEKMGQTTAAVSFLESLISKFPDHDNLYFLKLALLQELTPEKVKSFSEKIIEKFKDSPDILNTLAWELLDNGNFGTQQIDTAFKAAELAVKTIEKDKDYDKPLLAASLDTLARCYYNIGLLEKAIKYQAESLSYAKNSDDKAIIGKTLNYYNKLKILKQHYQE
jgi:thiol-disulfide isomerase/thioredoxin